MYEVAEAEEWMPAVEEVGNHHMRVDHMVIQLEAAGSRPGRMHLTLVRKGPVQMVLVGRTELEAQEEFRRVAKAHMGSVPHFALD